MDKLFDHQRNHSRQIADILLSKNRALDASRTGLGKTYCAIVSCLLIGHEPFIICPSMMIKTWVDSCRKLGCRYFGIASYELLQRCKMYNKHGKKTLCDFITYKNPEIKNGEETDYVVTDNLSSRNVCIIYDEIHKCKNFDTHNGKILKAFSITSVKILMLSATAADKPVYFILIGMVLKLYDKYENGHDWLIKQARIKNTQNFMLVFHDAIYPNYASKMNDEILLENYPNCKINAICYDMNNSEDIEKLYNNIESNTTHYLAERHKIAMKIEQLKIEQICIETKKQIKHGKSVIIFVNYIETVNEFMRLLETNCAIYGNYDNETCLKNMKKFNNDRERIIICTIKKASGSISLHDLHGNYPRVTYIFPPDSVTDLIQCIGRAWRVGVLTETIQNIVFSNCPEEQKLQLNMINKINNVSLLNNGKDTNKPLLIIENVIEETKDIVTAFGKKIKITKQEKQKLKNEMDAIIKKEADRLKYLNNLAECNDYRSLLSELKKIKYSIKNNTDESTLIKLNDELNYVNKLIDNITEY